MVHYKDKTGDLSVARIETGSGSDESRFIDGAVNLNKQEVAS